MTKKCYGVKLIIEFEIEADTPEKAIEVAFDLTGDFDNYHRSVSYVEDFDTGEFYQCHGDEIIKTGGGIIVED